MSCRLRCILPVSALTRRLFWCLFPELRSNKGNKHQNNTQVSAETVCHKSTYIILFLTWHKQSANDDKNDESYRSSPCLTRCFHSDGDVTTDCWFTSQWPDNCDTITSIVISNSLILILLMAIFMLERFPLRIKASMWEGKTTRLLGLKWAALFIKKRLTTKLDVS